MYINVSMKALCSLLYSTSIFSIPATFPTKHKQDHLISHFKQSWKKGTNCSGGWCSVLKKKVGQPQIASGELCKPDNGINWAAEREVSADDTFAQLSVCLSAEHMLAPEQPPSCPAAAVFIRLSRVTRMHHKFSLVLQNAKQGGLSKEREKKRLTKHSFCFSITLKVLKDDMPASGQQRHGVL